MNEIAVALGERAERYLPVTEGQVGLSMFEGFHGVLENISRSGAACSYVDSMPKIAPGTWLPSLRVQAGSELVECGPGRVVRAARKLAADGTHRLLFGVVFDEQQPALIERLGPWLRPYEYVTAELSPTRAGRSDAPETHDATAAGRTLDEFYKHDAPDILAKCTGFRAWTSAMQQRQIYQRLYRVTITGALDNRITVFDAVRRSERVMRCFDSNSYLGLHMHPRVNGVVQRVLSQVGYGTPSAQLLCGTNRYLRELEEKLSEIHGREETMVFPTGFAANIGTIGALVRKCDAVVRDRHAHASIQEGCRASAAGFNRRFEHNDLRDLASVLGEASAAGAVGKLVVTDGVFSMHGKIAPLPELLEVCRAHGARLMIDDAHGLGVLGAHGHGIEEHYGLPGQVDVLMGTLSKAVGCLGGYVSGSRDLIDYLRWFAPSGFFTTALPAAMCAGMREALSVMEEEPEHREALFRNVHYFVDSLRQAGFIVPPAESPIVTVFIGPQSLLWDMSRELFDAGVKCGNVIFPAVGKNETILRFTLNARHTPEDLDHAIGALTRIGDSFEIRGKSRQEIHERWGSPGDAAGQPRFHAK